MGTAICRDGETGATIRRDNGTGAGLWYNAAVPRPHRPAALRAFAPAWLAREEAARALLPDGFRDASTLAATVRRAAARAPSPALVAELTRQNAGLAPSPARERHLEALASGRAATVVTGQQVGLFTGPAFTIWKAAGAVAAARALEREGGVACVPVFWLQTEDHDWDEIDHCTVHGADGALHRIRAGSRVPHARASVSSRTFDDSVEAALGELEGALATGAAGERVLAMLRRHYRTEVSPSAAFRGVLAEIFADDGLVFLEPRTQEFAALARPHLERSFDDAAPVAGALARRTAEIEAAGFAVQVPVRDGSPLTFFHPDGADGPRYRLEPRGDGWRVCDGSDDRTVSRDEVKRAVAADPLAASTSALLRPLVQDALLPNAAYVAGPGEIAYLAEIQPLYGLLGLEPSIVIPRPSFCVTGAGDRRRLEQLGARFDGVTGDREAVLTALAGGDATGADALEQRLVAAFVERLEEFRPHALEVDRNLERPIDKTRSSVEHTVARLVDRYRHSLVVSDRVRVERVDRVRAALAPDGVPQERVLSFVSLAAEHGIDALMQAVRAASWPADGRTKEIAL